MSKSTKAVLKIVLGIVTFSILGLTTGLAAAQTAPLSEQEQELSRLVKEKIPNPSLRAALLGLGRTTAVDAISFILLAHTPEGLAFVKEIEFDDQGFVPESAIAAVFKDNTTGQLLILFEQNIKLRTHSYSHALWHMNRCTMIS